MTLDELIEQLTELRDDLETGDGHVYVATQPAWPLTNVIMSIRSNAAIMGTDEMEDSPLGSLDVWIAVDQVGMNGEVSPYAPSEAWG